jgi:beta-lactamase superfamily II metal-dependent hydrolase
MPFTVSILDVGHGNSAVVSVPGWVAVIDAGPGNALLSFLREQGVKVVDELLVSHADEDHIGGVIGLLASGEFIVRRVRLNTDAHKDSDIWQDLLIALDRAQRQGQVDFSPVLTVAENGLFDHDPIQLEILGPSTYLAGRGPGNTDRSGTLITTNSISAVIRVSVEGRRLVLFPGDIDPVGLDELLQNGTQDLHAEVLVFPHHGGRAGTTDVRIFSARITQAVRPLGIVFSIGRGRHATPLPEVVAAVRANASGVRIACTQLSERCASVLPQDEPTHLNPVFARGRERSHCCAGTIVITDGVAVGTVLPEAIEHMVFIKANAPSALCT